MAPSEDLFTGHPWVQRPPGRTRGQRLYSDGFYLLKTVCVTLLILFPLRQVAGASGGGGVVEGSNNTYGRNTARGNAGGVCAGPSTSDWCVMGLGNSSFGDNYIPNLF